MSFNAPRENRAGPRAGLLTLLLYAALAAALSSMAYLSLSGLAPLLPGAAAALVPPLLPSRRTRIPAMGLFLLAALLWALSDLAAFRDGAALLVNRLFAASEARQAYVYELLPVSPEAGTAELRRALVPLGAALGLLSSLSALVPPLGVLPFLLWAALAAWLGVTPSAPLLALTGLAAVLSLTGPSRGWAPLAAASLAALLVLGAVLLGDPGENAAVSRQDEALRDRLAAVTVAWTEETPPEEEPEPPEPPAPQEAPGKVFLRPEDADADTGGDSPWLKKLPVVLAVLGLLLLLFLPSLWADRLHRRRDRNRAGLESPDNAEAVSSMFLYALRRLHAAGFAAQAGPSAALADPLAERFPELKGYRDAYALFQKAAYSPHPVTDADRAAMRRFFEEAVTAADAAMTRRQRFRMRYVDAL